jgi:membrane-associated protease RseP (regulator of RpoE activity)
MIYLHILLFLMTIASTILVGGFLYSLAIMTILLCHELGHYLMSRRYGIPSTLPFFIPLPVPPFGTFGAVIKMKGVIVNRNALFDVGVAGPLCGFVVALPFIVAGIMMSTVTPLAGIPAASYMELGDPLLFRILGTLLVGDIPEGHDLVLHPFAYAGWVGLFVTSLNLLPVGQLDGGHVVYAVFGEKSKWVYRAVILGLGVLAALTNIGWLTLVILLLIFGMRHPRPFDDATEVNGTRKKIAILVLAIFILSFIPSPFPDMNLTKIIEKGF